MMNRPVSHLPVAASACLLLLLIACDQAPPASEAEPADAAAETEAVVETPTPAPAPDFDYPGGWLQHDTCVDICGVTDDSPVQRPPAVVCFDPDDAECQAKTGDGDYDYLMLSQHWLPTMCMGLAAGYDSTVTHQQGARCTANTDSRLALHGLWPNYKAGFPQCCGSALPLDPQKMRAWSSEFRQRLWQEQPDPTTKGFEPAICQIYNHEWQKHGTCFVETGDLDADAKKYFEVGLELTDRLASANEQLQTWAGTTQTREAIEALYPQYAQVLCDSRQPERLLEVHTCWSRDLDMVDCAPTEGFGSLEACGEQVTLPVWSAG